MTDRVPGAPGQYKAVITAEEFLKLQTGEQFTITMARDDQPLVEGTPYNKASVLPDELAAVICPGIADPTIADAFGWLAENAGLKLELLWENASPDSEFAAQTIALDSSAYCAVLINYRYSNTSSFYYNRFGFNDGITFTLPIEHGANNAVGRRTVTVTTESVKVDSAYFGGSETARATHVIPVKIYGIKGVTV